MDASTYFLSYSRIDEAFALRFARDLQAQGVAVWVDQFDIRPSEHWDRAIERAVQACRGLIVILSPRSVLSDNVADEISFAIENGKKVLPVLIERCTVPLRITRMHLIDATADYDRALRQCVAAIARPDGAEPTPAPAAVAPVALIAPEAVATAERRLTTLIGPIAGMLAAKAAARATSLAELYHLLAEAIPEEADRRRFLEGAPGDAAPAAPPRVAEEAPDTPAIPPHELDALAALLVAYLGPIAPLVVKREGRASRSRGELEQRLGALIASEHDRATFLRQLGTRGR